MHFFVSFVSAVKATDSVLAKAFVEAHPLPRQGIDVGRLHVGVTAVAKATGVVLIVHDQQDVWCGSA